MPPLFCSKDPGPANGGGGGAGLPVPSSVTPSRKGPVTTRAWGSRSLVRVSYAVWMLDRIEKLKKAYPNALAVSPVGEMNPDASYELRGFLVQVDPQNIAVYDDRGDFLGDEKTEWQSMNRISGAFMRRRFQPIDLATFGKVNAMISNLSAKLNAQGVDVEKPIPVVPETESGV